MKQLLIVSKKKVLCTHAEGILLPYDGADGDALKEWVTARYNMSVVKIQKVAKSDIVVLTVVEKQHCVQGEYISVAKAIELIDRENEPLHNYLNSLREEFDIQLEYGVKNGRIINIMDLPVESKGLQCDCVCPGCGGRLIARKGAKKKHHFAHYNEPCNLVAAQQTALHMLAKEIIEEEKRFLFPGYSVSRKEVEWEPDYQPYDYYQMPDLQYREPYRAKCESVTLERKICSQVDSLTPEKGKTRMFPPVQSYKKCRIVPPKVTKANPADCQRIDRCFIAPPRPRDTSSLCEEYIYLYCYNQRKVFPLAGGCDRITGIKAITAEKRPRPSRNTSGSSRKKCSRFCGSFRKPSTGRFPRQRRRFPGACPPSGRGGISSSSRHPRSISGCIPALRRWRPLRTGWHPFPPAKELSVCRWTGPCIWN